MERALEVLLLAAPAWPVLRLVTTRTFLRRLRGLPSVAAALAGGLAAYAAAIAIVTLYLPALLRPLALLAGAAVVCERWRARPAYGRARGLPPGSLALLPVAPLRDHLFYLTQARRHGPIFKTTQFLRPMVCIVGLPRAVELLSRQDAVLEPPPLPFNRLVPGGLVRYMALAEHAAFVPVLRAAFTRDAVVACEPLVAACVRDELRRMVADGAAAGVAPLPYLARLVRISFARIFLGVTPETAAFTKLTALAPYLDVRNFTRPRRSERALEEVGALVRAEATRLAALDAPPGGPPGSFLEALVRADPAAVQNPTVVCNLACTMENSAGDVTGLLNWLLKHLTEHPRWIVPLRAEHERANGARPADDLATRIVLETLRLEQIEYLYRNVAQDLPLDGFVIPKGWLLRICVRESHRNPDVFAEPDTFDPDRFLGRTYARTEYAPFGNLGSHLVCLGEQLTKTMGRIFVSELAAGFDWCAVSDGPRESSGWHWTPSRTFRVRLTPRA